MKADYATGVFHTVAGFGYAFSFQGERCEDSFFLASKGPHMGALRLFGGKPVATKDMRGVAAKDLAFAPSTPNPDM